MDTPRKNAMELPERTRRRRKRTSTWGSPIRKNSHSNLHTALTVILWCCLVEFTRGQTPPEASGFICMSQQEVSTCNTFGTDLSLVASLQDEPRCQQESRQSSLTTAAPLGRDSDYLVKATQCPCKANYSGPKCDTCSDGLHMRFHHFREDQPATNQGARDDNKLRPATFYRHGTNGTNRRANRSFSCQLCNCDPFGAKSLNCDKRNGTCFCVDGYTGPKCDKCSLGYYNKSAADFHPQTGPNSLLASASIGGRRQCVECGECFNQWHVRTIDLKDTSVELIKRAYELASGSSSSSSPSPSPSPTNGPMEQSATQSDWIGNSAGLFDKWGSSDELDEKLRSIGERVLTNKHNSDKLNLLAGEMVSLVDDCNRTASNVSDLRHMNQRMETRIIKSNYLLRVVHSLVGEKLHRIVDKFAQDQISAQEDLPRGAFRLIWLHSNMSSATKESSIKFQEQSRPHLEALKERLHSELAILNSSHLALHQTGYRWLNESLEANQLHDFGFLANLSTLGGTLRPEKRPHHHRLDQSVALKLLDMDLGSRVESYLSKNEADELDLQKLNASISEILTILDGADSALDRFHFSWLTLLRPTSLDDMQAIEPWTIMAEFESSTKSLQANADRCESKLRHLETEGDTTFDPGSIANHTKTIQMIGNLTGQINRTLASKMAHWDEFELAHKSELLQLNSLKKRSNSLFHESLAMGKNITLLREMGKLTNRLKESTKQTIDRTNQDMASLSGLDESALLSRDVNRVWPRIATLRDEYLIFETKTIERKLIQSYQANKIRHHIENATMQNEHLLGELSGNCQELAQMLNVSLTPPKSFSAAGDSLQVNKRQSQIGERQMKLSHNLRAQKLAEAIERLARDLVQMVGTTTGLSAEFATNERILLEQNKTMHLLQDEVDLLATELELGLASCGTSECRPAA